MVMRTVIAMQHDNARAAFDGYGPNGAWELHGGESWRQGSEERRTIQRNALSWCDPGTRLTPGVLWRGVVTAVVFVRALIRWRVRSWRGKATSRAAAAEAFREAAERLGATWIKLGQLIAAGEGIFPDELVAECRKLHDRVRPEPWKHVEAALIEAFGVRWAEIFTIERTPIAAASIAQTHRITFANGTDAVVKIQRRGVATRIERDVRALAKVAPLLVGRIPISALANPPALLDIFTRCVAEELDFRVEATNATEIANVIATYGTGGIFVPRPHPELVTRGAMVLEYRPGRRLDGLDANLGGKVIDTLVACILEGALLGGVFHGDLHPGNMAVVEDGSVVLYDFGIVARLDEGERAAFIGLVAGGATGNWRQQLQSLARLGAFPLDSDFEVLGRELGLEHGPVDPSTLAPEALAAEAAKVAKTLLGAGARLPKALMLWGKNLAFLDSAVGRLCPDRDMVSLIVSSLTSFTTRHGTVLAQSALGGVQIEREVLAGALAAGEGTLTWNEIRAKRALILERQRKHQQRRGKRRARTPVWIHGEQ
jgi:ubiquinone biosynthesis protein